MCGSSDKEVPETEEEIALAQIADERWARYKTKFRPIENIAIKDVMEENKSPSDFGANVANLSTQAEFSRMEPAIARGLTLRGARVGSGAFEGGIRGLNVDRAAATGLGQANAQGLQRTQNLQNMQSLVNLGQGQAGEALSGYGDAAAQAQREAILNAQASAAARAAVGQAVGTGAGMWYGSATRPGGG